MSFGRTAAWMALGWVAGAAAYAGMAAGELLLNERWVVGAFWYAGWHWLMLEAVFAPFFVAPYLAWWLMLSKSPKSDMFFVYFFFLFCVLATGMRLLVSEPGFLPEGGDTIVHGVREALAMFVGMAGAYVLLGGSRFLLRRD